MLVCGDHDQASTKRLQVTVPTALLREEVDVLKCMEWHKVSFFPETKCSF